MTFGPVLVFVFAASLPVLFVLAVNRWIEADYRRSNQRREQEHDGLGQDNRAKPSDSADACTRNTEAPRSDAAEDQADLRRIEMCYDSD